MSEETTIRPFDGSLSDAQQILAVEGATFGESPYSAEQIRDMLDEGPQRAWLAVGVDKVVGFVVAFMIQSLLGRSWEIDYLAVLPAWRGRRLGTRLIQAAATYGAGLADRSRAVVATDNAGSSRAFARVGYRAGAEIHELLICRPQELTTLPSLDAELSVRDAGDGAELASWLQGDLIRREVPALGDPDVYDGRLPVERQGLVLHVVERKGQVVGHAELVAVQTILYRGMWIESLVAQDRAAREALLSQILSQGRAAGLDEIGAMVPHSNRYLQQVLRVSGFRSLGQYRWHTADLASLGVGEAEL